MTRRVLVTGATGLVGANFCEIAVERGDAVRALVRSKRDADLLGKLGVDLVEGDVTDLRSVTAAMEGIEFVVHSAAVLGPASNDIRLQESVNTHGSVNVFEAARRCGVQRTVAVSSPVVFRGDTTLTESSHLPSHGHDTAYSITKRMAFLDAQRRIAGGQDLNFVVPAAVYGPSPLAVRATAHPSWNNRFLRAIRGEIPQYVDFRVPLVYARDVGAVIDRAADKGEVGGVYLAMGRPEDCVPIAVALSRVCALAGVPTRIRNVPSGEIPPGEEAQYGSAEHVQLSHRGRPDPLFDSRRTNAALDVDPTPTSAGFAVTVDWFRQLGLI